MTESSTVVQGDLENITLEAREEIGALAGKHLVITGGAGFLGYYLVKAIVFWNRQPDRRKVRLTVLDNFARGMPGWLSELDGEAELTVLEHDITRGLPDLAADFDYLIHAASIASPAYYRQHPIETIDANVNGLRLILEQARRRQASDHPVSGILFFSSSEIYGDPTADMIPTPEDYPGLVSCTGPRACYDESKRFGETLCVNFQRQHGLAVKIARPFNNYGPGLKLTDGRVIPDFARDILAQRDIVMYSDGAPQRTFCYVADAVAGYYRVLLRGRPGESYNIGTAQPMISVAELAQLMIRTARQLFGYQGKLVRRESADTAYLVHNPNRRCPNIEKAQGELGFRPGVDLAEGIRRSLIWYRENQEGTES